ncbi:hypothetical protein OS493_024533 [Desmophyllum pertusum]|uniref:Uncharacterized protein n=1 Tax=Desmophyllum pertusum TaxID=174260 RepID=A0A9W9ZZ38_9CNID|nr:hypothetical protein OS493_024533 [Desmophyllum pertusum]
MGDFGVLCMLWPSILISSKIYKKEEDQQREDDEVEPVNISKSGLFYSPPKQKYLPPEGRGPCKHQRQ